MNIKQVKRQIEGAVRAYLAKDRFGAYRIPQHMQRPVIVFGPPGIGKTAVAAQVADGLGINFLSYSITHHTRQSALGLPFITTEEFDGREYNVADYTMSEIIAAVHRMRAASGVSEGILFLDEINCVSETLSPALLQFLQFKTFGMHRLPDGWIIVCAGNPPEYNHSARTFDPALLDRVKRIDAEADVDVWQEYAIANRVHPAVTTFLDAKPSSFYLVRAGASAMRLVTARGWEDLSRILQVYEDIGLEADADLVRQYLQDDQVAIEFFNYYSLFRKYQDDYQVTTILDGDADADLIARAAQAPFDERLAVVGLLLDALLDRVHYDASRRDALERERADLKAAKAEMDEEAFESARATFNASVDGHEASVARTMASVDSTFRFLDDAFGAQSQEALIAVTKLSADPTMVRAVAMYGSEEYLKHNKDLLLSERATSLLRQIDEIGLK